MPETFPATADFSALTRPITMAEVAAYRRETRASGAPWSRNTIAVVLWTVIGAMVAIFVFIPVFASFATGSPGSSALFLVVAVVGIAVAVALSMLASRTKWGGWMRLDRFARANGLTFTPVTGPPAYAGAIFQEGSERRIRDRLTATTGRYFDIGNYEYTTGSGKSRQVHHWGYLAVRLDRPMPHILLDAKSNNGLFGATNLPEVFARSQRLSLEGDFDRYFTLYCPREYERDALYLLTPDLMALLIDEAQAFDVEVVDDWMLVYSSAPFRMTDASVVRRLFRILATVGSKTTDRAGRYSDDHAGAEPGRSIAPQGRRLRQSFPVLGLVIAAFLVGWWLIDLFTAR
ncbi:hypothetical protein [Leifsonia sp. NPDC058230]|uniref:hypothetical protein n=1 Tax=Leifsonia sp. NPDC058230 TaxID=3346391 RepID=UPI0036DC12B0